MEFWAKISCFNLWTYILIEIHSNQWMLSVIGALRFSLVVRSVLFLFGTFVSRYLAILPIWCSTVSARELIGLSHCSLNANGCPNVLLDQDAGIRYVPILCHDALRPSTLLDDFYLLILRDGRCLRVILHVIHRTQNLLGNPRRDFMIIQ